MSAQNAVEIIEGQVAALNHEPADITPELRNRLTNVMVDLGLLCKLRPSEDEEPADWEHLLDEAVAALRGPSEPRKFQPEEFGGHTYMA